MKLILAGVFCGKLCAGADTEEELEIDIVYEK